MVVDTDPLSRITFATFEKKSAMKRLGSPQLKYLVQHRGQNMGLYRLRQSAKSF